MLWSLIDIPTSNFYIKIISETHTYRNIYPITLWGQKNPIKSMTYSRVAFAWCKGGGRIRWCPIPFLHHSPTPTFYCSKVFKISILSLWNNHWTKRKGRTFDQIAEWLNKKGYLSVRGSKFKGDHVHSIVKKKKLKDEKLEKEYPEVRSDFSLEVVDKTLVNMFEDFLGWKNSKYMIKKISPS